MTQVLDIIQQYLEFKKIKNVRLDGTMKTEDRTQSIDNFKEDKDVRVFLLSTKAGGHGLNLQTANTVFLFDSDWNPMNDKQAIDRVHRIGQATEVRVFRFISNDTIEEYILHRANEKKDLDEKIIQAGMFNQKTSDQERQKNLEMLFKRPIQKTEENGENQEKEDEEVPVLCDQELNELMARGDHELKLFEQMDLERYERENKVGRMEEI